MNRADIRWGGSESGTVNYPCWSTFPYPFSHSNQTETNAHHQLLKHGDKDGKYWVPAMADAPLRGENGRHEWFWEPDDENNIYSVENLMEIYEKSVGRNATLIMGLTPNPDGLLPTGDVQRLKEWGNEIQRRFTTPLGTVSGQRKSLTIDLKKKQRIDYYLIQENIANGERIHAYQVEAKINGKWEKVAIGESVGHKRIEKITPIETTALRLTISKSIAMPDIKNFSIYNTNN